MVSIASGGRADRIAARMLFKVLRAGSGTPARYSSILFGASPAFAADLRVAGLACFMQTMLQALPLQIHDVGGPSPTSARISFDLDEVADDRSFLLAEVEPGDRTGRWKHKSSLDVLAGPDERESIAYRLTLPPSRHCALGDFRVLVISIGGRTALGEAGNTAQGIGRHMCRIIVFDVRFAHRFGRRMEMAPIGARQLFVLPIALSCDDLCHRRQLRGFLRSRIDE